MTEGLAWGVRGAVPDRAGLRGRQPGVQRDGVGLGLGSAQQVRDAQLRLPAAGAPTTGRPGLSLPVRDLPVCRPGLPVRDLPVCRPDLPVRDLPVSRPGLPVHDLPMHCPGFPVCAVGPAGRLNLGSVAAGFEAFHRIRPPRLGQVLFQHTQTEQVELLHRRVVRAVLTK